MKKFISILLVLGAVLTMAFASPTQLWADENGNTVLVMKGKQNSEMNEIEIDVTIKENTGVCGVLLSLVYDTSVFTLTDLEYGTALSDLLPIHTNAETESGYGVYPFKISYLGEENDTSIGNMMTLRFAVKENAPDGDYTITLTHERDKDVTYLKNNRILTKNLLIDGAKITISENQITSIDTIDHSEPNENKSLSNQLWLPLLIGGLVVIGGGCLVASVMIKRNKTKKWKKI